MVSKHPLNAPNQKYHNFTVTKAIAIPELQCFLTELVHEPTGAQIMHIGNDDPENMFCLSFQTLPESSNGVAHILEHTVLCGSKKFPVKDPFFAMSRRSLNTYMNALTGSDFTCYPAATQVTQDFYNLLEVYLDAVFKPNLNELSFLQEGHRLEFSTPDNPKSQLEYKGVVFNEMKGAMASSSARLTEALNEALYPNLTYGFNSGGEPKVIPKLTYNELKEFHQKFYHPSRCLFFFYGNMPLTDHLDFIAEYALHDVEKVPPLPPLPPQPRFKEPRRSILNYPIAEEEETEDKTLIGFGWLTCHVLEQHELLALYIIAIILMDTDASPLKMALLRSGLCKTASAYLEPDISEVPLVITLKGCNADRADDIENIIRRTLQEIVKEEIPLEMVENAMHQLEFHRSEIVGDHSPFGLSLFMRSALLKQHGAKPEEGLMIHSLFEGLRRHFIKDPFYLNKLIQKHLIDNTHFVRITLVPDKELAAKELKEEKEALEKIHEKLTEKQIQKIIHKAAELAEFQKKQEEQNQDILPKISLKDVPTYARDYELIKEKAGSLHVFHHSCFTNEIVYADLVYDLPDIAEEDLPYVRLFTNLIPQMGCGGRNYAQNLDYIQANTGGISASLMLNIQSKDFQQFYPSLHIRGKALHRKAPKLFPLLQDLASSIDFTDIMRLKEVIMKHYTALESTLNQSALKYAINLSASGLTVASKIANEWYGLNYFWKIQEIAKNFDAYANQLVNKFQFLQKKLLCLENPHLVLSCDSNMYDTLKGHEFYGLQHIETNPSIPWKGKYSSSNVKSQGRVIASPIAFIGKVFGTISYIHPHSPALNIAAFLFDNLTLHIRLREQGGAYGGGAVSNSLSGNFYFYSYRDPNIHESLEAFNEAVNELVEGNFDDSDLEEAKLEMIQGLDAPISPGSRGDLAYGWLREGKTFKIRQAYRDKLLSLTREEIVAAVKEELVPKMNTGSVVVFAGRELLEKENEKLISKGMKPLPIETI